MVVISVEDLESCARHDLASLVMGRCRGSMDYVEMRDTAMGLRWQTFEYLLSAPEAERAALVDTPDPDLWKDLGDLISNILILCARARQHGWTVLAVPEQSSARYALVHPSWLEQLNAHRYENGLAEAEPGLLRVQMQENPN